MNGTIYKITNTTNGKAYIGQTTRDVSQRWEEHLSGAFKNEFSERSALQKALRAYGTWNFEFEVLETGIQSQAELTAKETYYIVKYKTIDEYNANYGNGPKSERTCRLPNSMAVGAASDEEGTKGDESSDEYWEDNVDDDNYILFNRELEKGFPKRLTLRQYNLFAYCLLMFTQSEGAPIEVDLKEFGTLMEGKIDWETEVFHEQMTTIASEWNKNYDDTAIEVLLEPRTAKVSLSPKLESMFKRYRGSGSIKIGFNQFVELKVSSKQLLLILTSRKYKGALEISREELYRDMLVSDVYVSSYKAEERILKPAMNELLELMPNLKLKKLKRGRNVVGLRFTGIKIQNKKKKTKVKDSINNENSLLVHNDFNYLSFKELSPHNWDMLICILKELRGDSSEITFDYSIMKDWTTLVRVAPSNIEIQLERFYAKSKAIDISGETVSLFEKFELDSKNKTFTLKLNSELDYLISSKNRRCSSIDIELFKSLETKYSKSLYRILNENKKECRAEISLEEFKRIADVPESYDTRRINRRIIKEMTSELSEIFGELKVTSLKRGNKTVGYSFTWV